jgi:hypothetical protein
MPLPTPLPHLSKASPPPLPGAHLSNTRRDWSEGALLRAAWMMALAACRRVMTEDLDTEAKDQST